MPSGSHFVGFGLGQSNLIAKLMAQLLGCTQVRLEPAYWISLSSIIYLKFFFKQKS